MLHSFWSVTFFPCGIENCIKHKKNAQGLAKRLNVHVSLYKHYITLVPTLVGGKAQVRGRRAERSGVICTGRKKL